MRKTGGMKWMFFAVAFCFFLACRAGAEEKPKFELLFEDTLSTTEGIAVCPDGSFYTVENASGKLYRILSDTKVELYAEGVEHAAGLACGPDNALYALKYAAGEVLKITSVKEKSETKVNVETFATGLKSPNGAVVMKDGTLLVSETDAGRVARIAPYGKKNVVVEGIMFANGLVLNGDETVLYVAATTSGRIYAVRMAGENAGKKEVFKKGVQMVDGIARDAAGNFYVCLYATGQVARVAPDGAVTMLATGLKSPASPAIRDGVLYVTTLGGKGLYRIPLPVESK